VKYSVQKDHSKCNYKTSPFISIAHQLSAFSHLKIFFFFARRRSKHSQKSIA